MKKNLVSIVLLALVVLTMVSGASATKKDPYKDMGGINCGTGDTFTLTVQQYCTPHPNLVSFDPYYVLFIKKEDVNKPPILIGSHTEVYTFKALNPGKTRIFINGWAAFNVTIKDRYL